MNVALVCIAKNEDNYIDEWIEYHIKIGFSKIIIYQNDWRYKGKYKNESYIELIEYDGICKQVPAYNNFIINNYNKYDWAGFYDVDEFIVLKQKSNISDFLNDYNEYYSLGINWNMFGTNGLEFNGEYSVIKRFIKCRKKLVEEIKSFINFNKAKNTIFMKCPHSINMNNKTISVDKSHFINGPLNKENLDNREIAYINHYYVKTKTEWDQKVSRGTPCNFDGKFSIPDHWFNLRTKPEYDEYEDLTAYNFMYGDRKGN